MELMSWKMALTLLTNDALLFVKRQKAEVIVTGTRSRLAVHDLNMACNCNVFWNTFVNFYGWILLTKRMEFVEFLRWDSSASTCKAVRWSGSIVGSVITGSALRRRAIKIMKTGRISVENSAPQFNLTSPSRHRRNWFSVVSVRQGAQDQKESGSF